MAFLLNLSSLILLISLLSAILAASQSDCNVRLNSSLSADGSSPRWLSPSGEFAFGFRPLPRSPSNNQDLYLLSVWYNKIPEQTIVWSENAHPIPEGSRIQLTSEGQLILYDHRGEEIWRAETGNQRSTCGAMLDSGNMVLINGDSNYTWESFRFPTDTMLPGQRLIMDGNLSSRQSDTDFSDGRFQLLMQGDGNLVLYTIFLPTEYVSTPYWSSKTMNFGFQLVFNESGYIYIQARNGSISNITSKDMGSRQDFYHMARLDADGVFRHYHHPRRNFAVDTRGCSSAWSVVQTNPEDICTAVFGELGSGACGYNSYCVNSNGRPSCFCPEGYSPLDPLDNSKGCKPDFQLPSCQQNGWESNSEFVEFKELNNTDWPLTDYELQTGSQVNKEMCKEFCLRDCFCAVAIYNGNSCWKKKFPLSNGRQTAELNRIALIKVPRNNATSFCPKGKDQSTVIIVISALLGSSVLLNFLFLTSIAIAIFFIYHKKLLYLQSASSVYGVRMYSYKELEKATGGFKDPIGSGSFGSVYKGVVPTIPKRFIAIVTRAATGF